MARVMGSLDRDPDSAGVEGATLHPDRVIAIRRGHTDCRVDWPHELAVLDVQISDLCADRERAPLESEPREWAMIVAGIPAIESQECRVAPDDAVEHVGRAAHGRVFQVRLSCAVRVGILSSHISVIVPGEHGSGP